MSDKDVRLRVMWLGFSSTFHATDDKEIVQSAVYVVLLSNCTLPDKRIITEGGNRQFTKGKFCWINFFIPL